MTRSPIPPLLQELQNPTTPASQLAALKALKNELIGHELRKETWISYGIIPILSGILASRDGLNGKRVSREVNGHGAFIDGPLCSSEEEACCVQAVVLVGILAQAGPRFVKPILNGSILPHLVANLSSSDCTLHEATAILKTLNTIADRLPPAVYDEWPLDRQLSSLLYSEEHVGCLIRVLEQSSPSALVQHTISLAIALICKTCTEERQRAILVDAGALSALATRLSSFVVSQGFVLPGAENHLSESGSLGALPVSAPARARLEPTLKAIAILIEHSRRHATLFLSSPAIVTVFPEQQVEFSPTDVKKMPWGSSTYLSGAAVPRHNSSNPIDSLLPVVPVVSAKALAEHANFPPLGSGGPTPKKRTSFHSPSIPMEPSNPNVITEEEENPIIAWLIYLVRAESGMCRLMAAKLLVALFALGFAKKSRTPMFCMLLVPLLTRVLDKDYEVAGQAEPAEHDILPLKLRIQEETPSILADLVMDSQRLQKAAVDCQAIKKLSHLLKETFEQVPSQDADMWCPKKVSGLQPHRLDADRVLGEKAPTTMARHIMKFREGLLQALASIASFDDDYKKAICDQGIVPYIIDSLKPYTSSTTFNENNPKVLDTTTGNAASTVLAACGAARALTRSVSVLRTSLIDAGVGPPLFVLLHHPDIEVQIAATKVVSNLAMDFSPMKEAIIQHNVVQSLCQHAHSANARLRFESLWALKHLVLNSSNDLKIKVVQELGPDWLKQLMATDPAEIPEGTILGIDPASMARDDLDDIVMGDNSSPNLNKYKKSVIQRRQDLYVEDVNPYKHTIEDDIAIQAQVFDLIRNLFCGEEAAEMIEYVLKEMIEKEFFEILLDRVRSRTIAGPTRKDTKTTPASNDIIIKVLYIVVHIAASLPKYRTLVASQTNLLRQVLSFLSHSEREIRVQCCWIAINLTYGDDESDRVGCKQRAQELQRMGFHKKFMSMVEDVDLDVRERAKTARDLIRASA